MQRNDIADKKPLYRRILAHKYVYLLGLPGMIYYILFQYVPMYNIAIAFENYDPFTGVFHSPWVGFANFVQLFHDPEFFMIFRNTLVISLLTMCLFPAPIILALLLNEIRNRFFKKSIQTVVYLPHFVSWVIVVSLTYLFLSSQVGYVNSIIQHFGGQPISFMLNNKYFYPLILMQNVWKTIGWGSIVYLAAIAGVNPSLYEAATMDGAGKLKQMWHVTIPAIMPTIVILFILQLGMVLNVNFEQLWLMQNPINLNLSEVFETYVYKTGVLNGQFSYTTAIGLFKSIIALLLILGSNYLAKRRGHEGIW